MKPPTTTFKPGDRVISTANLGLVRDDGPRTRFAGAIEVGKLGTVLDMDLGMLEPGWVAIRFDDVPTVDGDPVHAPAGLGHISFVRS